MQSGDGLHKQFVNSISVIALTLGSLCCLATINVVIAQPSIQVNNNAPNYAFYYGDVPPVDALQAFDKVVVDPASNLDPQNVSTPNTKWLAYVSVGEVEGWRDYADKIPKQWLQGNNPDWKTKVIDQSSPDWPAFFVANVITPLWNRGYRGFFLDTLDSYQLVAKTPEARAQQQAGLIAVIQAIKSTYPEADLVLNRGFEILPQVSNLVSAVALESLYRGWNQRAGHYTEVSEKDRQWLLGQIQTIRDNYQLPVIAIEYCAPEDTACADFATTQIRQLGVIPYVTDGALSTIGRGLIQVMARRVLIVQNNPADTTLDDSSGLRFLAMPLNYLGYRVEYADIKKPLPKNMFGNDYAGVVVWYNQDMGKATSKFVSWLKECIHNGVPVVFMNQFGAPIESALGDLLKLTPVDGSPEQPFKIESKDPMMGFEVLPIPDSQDVIGVLAGPKSESLLRLRSGDYVVDAAAITPWGGYALAPYAVFTKDKVVEGGLWSIQPLTFLSRALRLGLVPVPDTTTENGRRLLMAHVDGDGFASRSEFTDTGYSGEILMEHIWKKHRIPTTLSVIEGEVGSAGLYPKLSPALEKIAREMFDLPHVEIGSHTFSHPFSWTLSGQSQSPVDDDKSEGIHLNIPGYKFSLDREIAGSLHYVNGKLTTEKKPAAMLLWSGDCQVPLDALKKATAAGVLNMNGGDTSITKTNRSWVRIAPLGVNRGDGFYQVYAPNQNEQIYTNNWTGPFYGFQRVIETFQLTDTPYRFKPVNIYYHMYSGTKLASLKALEEVYDHALAQPHFPVHATEYVRKVHDFENASVARDGDNWIVSTGNNLRTIRIPSGMAPNLANAQGVAGYNSGPNGTYVHLSDSRAKFAISTHSMNKNAGPYLADANGQVSNLRRTGNTLAFDFKSHVHGIVRLAQANACQVSVNGKSAKLVSENGVHRVSFDTVNNNTTHQLEVRCDS